jgi:hypothetical protein
MRLWHGLLPAVLACAPCGAALAQDFAVTAIALPADTDSVAAAKLPAAELKQILDQVEQSSFDTPDAWESELRLRRVPLGGGDGLVVRGTAMLCGGTGNCETWLFRRVDGVWVNLLDGEAPVVASLGFGQHLSHAAPDLVATTHLSATASSRTVYVFDGKVYRPDACYEVDGAAAQPAVTKVACK